MDGYSSNQNNNWKTPQKFQVYIKNFPPSWTEINLDTFFVAYNAKSKIIKNPPAQMYAFLTVASYETQQEVIKNWNGKTPQGHSQPFHIDQAKKKEKKTIKQTTPVVTNHPVSPSVTSYPPSTTKVPVTFEWTQPGNEVSVIGSFFYWNLGNAVSLVRKPQGTFEAVIELEPNEYEYRFIVDGNWKSDLSKPLKGENNYIVVVPQLKQQQPLPQYPIQPQHQLPPQNQPQPKPQSQHQPQPKSQSQHQPQPKPQSPSQSQHQPQPKPQSPSQSQHQPHPKSQPHPKPQSQYQQHPKSQPHPKPQSQHQPHPKSQSPYQPHSQSQHQSHPKSQPQSQTKPKSQSKQQPSQQQQKFQQPQFQQPQLQQQPPQPQFQQPQLQQQPPQPQFQQPQFQQQQLQQPQFQQQQQLQQPQFQQPQLQQIQLQPQLQALPQALPQTFPPISFNPYLQSPIPYIPYGTPYSQPVPHPFQQQPTFPPPTAVYPYILPTLPVTTPNTILTTPEEKKVILTIQRLWSSSGEPFKLSVNSSTPLHTIRFKIFTPPREYQTKYQQIYIKSTMEGENDQVLGAKVRAEDLDGRKLFVSPWKIINEKKDMESWLLDQLVDLVDKENWGGINGFSLLSLYLKNVFLLSHENHLIQYKSYFSKNNTQQHQYQQQYHLSWFDTLLYTNNSSPQSGSYQEEIYCCLKYNISNNHLVVQKYLKKSQLPQNILPDKNRRLYTLLRNPDLWKSENNKLEKLYSNLEKLEKYETALRNSIFSEKIQFLRNRPEQSLILEKLTNLYQQDILVRENDLKRELIRPEKWRNITEQQYSEIVRMVGELNLGGTTTTILNPLPEVLSDAENEVGIEEGGGGEDEPEETPFLVMVEEPQPPPLWTTSRFTDGLERDPLNVPVQFWNPGYHPTQSLLEVLASFGVLGKNALVGAQNKPPDTRLSVEEMALLFLYTMEGTAQFPSVYAPVNSVMRDGTPKDHLKYRDFIFYLEEILGKLDSYDLPVYRGIPVQIPGYRQNITITWPAFSSCTCDPKIAIDFIRQEKGTLFIIQSKRAKSVERYSVLGQEKEVLYPPNVRFRVKSVVDFAIKKMLEVSLNKDLSNVVLLQLEEIEVMGGSLVQTYVFPQLYKCINCNASFTDKVQFKVHVEECNASVDKYYTCNNCKEKFYSKTDKFYAHISICNVQESTKQNIRYCRNCPFSSNVFSDWQTHIRACNGTLGKPYG